MSATITRPVARALAPLLLALAGACTVGRVRVTDLDAMPPYEGTPIRAHVRAHLADGSTVVFRRGARFERGRIRGRGERWGLGAGAPVASHGVALDSVVAVESFERRIDWRATVLLNLPLEYFVLGIWIMSL